MALELLSLVWKDEEAKGVGSGTSLLAEGTECAKAGGVKRRVQLWAGPGMLGGPSEVNTGQPSTTWNAELRRQAFLLRGR